MYYESDAVLGSHFGRNEYFDFKLGATLGLLRLEMKVILTSSTRTRPRDLKMTIHNSTKMAHCLRNIQRLRFNTNLWCFRILFFQLILLINPIFNFFALTLIFEFNFKFQGRWTWNQLDNECVGDLYDLSFYNEKSLFVTP